ncbi:hypothetical protein LOTGIDRAFT_104442 [Lottia gigantea]|uniref:RFX1-4/6/8-like BCD domain-containing protein n=1 Tax=Lottia gigantea TaxID=225164 RepID=V4AV29_LOTGI|nr:hypothetical protein LOTGIDRAFT_104442 [Lottia gigantea]ESO97686.1 hypothetical protein LOTGIDRAFT_104442 [Lottia gigantea]
MFIKSRTLYQVICSYRYHYYGIGIKESSIHDQSVYTGKGLSSYNPFQGSQKKYSLCSHTGTLLPDFPDIDNFILLPSIDRDKISTFFMMYRTHCQRILDTIIGSHFEEVEGLMLHFWQGMPKHLDEILNNTITSDVISWCDSALYKVLVDVLIPSSIQDLPQSLKNEIEEFITKLPYWIKISVDETSQKIQNVKINICQRFVKIVKRHYSFIHLSQTARGVLLNTENVNTVVKDLGEVDLPQIISQLQFIYCRDDLRILTISESFETFKVLLLEQASIEYLIEWLDELLDKNVFNVITEDEFDDAVAADFLLNWSLIGAFIMRDLTLQSASSFGIYIFTFRLQQTAIVSLYNLLVKYIQK